MELPPRPDTIGAAIGARAPLCCPGSASIQEVADLLAKSDRTSAVVKDDSGMILGVLTENDILVGFAKGVGRESKVHHWLNAGDARFSGNELASHTVTCVAPLSAAAQLMRKHKNNDHACHHLVVHNSAGEVVWILSAMDIVRRLVALGPDADALIISERTGRPVGEELLGGKRVLEVMKRRSELPECRSNALLSDAFRTMKDSGQNCIIIADDRQDGGVCGIITPRDLLYAYTKLVSDDITCEQWLQSAHTLYGVGFRSISADTGLFQAAHVMCIFNLHHLTVMEECSTYVQGVLSSLDLVCCIQDRQFDC